MKTQTILEAIDNTYALRKMYSDKLNDVEYLSTCDEKDLQRIKRYYEEHNKEWLDLLDVLMKLQDYRIFSTRTYNKIIDYYFSKYDM